MELIKKLREKTNAGIVDCKNALAEANNDFDKAVDILRKKGILRAAKRSEREASQGLIKVSVNSDQTEGYIMEVNSETDFVARTEQFQKFAADVLTIIIKDKPSSLADLMNLTLANGTIKETLDHLSGVIGEKLEIRRFDIVKSSGIVAAYSHMGGKIGALVAIDKKDLELSMDLAMQVAAANPRFLSPDEIPADEITKEKAIYNEQPDLVGKPDAIREKIIAGKLEKFYGEICLLKQEFIKDDKKKVADILGNTKVEKFVRYSL